jgi:hypothetical protein
MQFTYEIGGKKYIQKKLVFGQIRQLESELSGITVTSETTIIQLINKLIGGGMLSKFFAIILTPEGTKLKDKNIDELASEIEFDIDIELGIKVIEDFFACNQIASIFEKLIKAVEALQKKQIGSMNLSASLQTETSQKETISPGDTDPTMPNLISNTDKENFSSEKVS